MSEPQEVEPGQGKRTGPRKPPKGLIVLLIAVIAAGAVGAVVYYTHSRAYQSTNDAFITAHITRVSPRVPGHVVAVHVDDNQWVEAGDLLVELDPRDFRVDLDQAQANLKVAEAQQEASAISLELTKATAYAQLREAESAVSVAESALHSAEASVQVANAQLDQARGEVAVAQATAQQAKADVAAAQAKAKSDMADLQRYKELSRGNVIAQQQLEHVQAAADASAANLTAAREKVAAAESQVSRSQAAVATAQGSQAAAQSKSAEARASLDEIKARLASAQTAPQQVSFSEAQARVSGAQVQRARSAVEEAQIRLSYTGIVAPVPGRVTNKMVEVGDYVQVGQSLMALVPKDMWVVANFRETELARLRPGQPVDIEVDAHPGKVFQGRVDSLQAGTGAVFSLLPPENATGYFVKVVQRVPVKIVFNEPPDLALYHLGPGMSVVPTVHLREGPTGPPLTSAAEPASGGNAQADLR